MCLVFWWLFCLGFLDDDFIYISLQLLLEHQDAIATEPNDLLNELLEGLGPVPDVESFLGKLFFIFMVIFTPGVELNGGLI